MLRPTQLTAMAATTTVATTELILTVRPGRDEWLAMETADSRHHGVDDAGQDRLGRTFMEWTDRSRLSRNATPGATR